MTLGRVWVRLAAAVSAALIMGAMVMLLGMALTAGVAPGLPHANAKPGDNHGTPGDNKKKKKDDDDNDRDNRGSDSRDSSSDSERSSDSTSGGDDQKAQTEQNNRWTPDGSNRSVDTRIDSPEQSQQTPPRQEQPVYEGTPDDGAQDAAQPPATESPTPSSVSVEQQDVPRIVLPPQEEFQNGDQISIEVEPANNTGSTDTTNTVIAVTAAGLGAASRFRGGSRGSSSPAQRGGFGLTHLGHETGDQTLITMNDPSSPDTYEFDTSNLTPEGGSLRLNQDGSVSILDASGGDTGDGFTTPWAHDANGVDQPTNFTVEDTTLTQHIQPRPDAVYPITADPNGIGSYAGAPLHGASQSQSAPLPRPGEPGFIGPVAANSTSATWSPTQPRPALPSVGQQVQTSMGTFVLSADRTITLTKPDGTVQTLPQLPQSGNYRLPDTDRPGVFENYEVAENGLRSSSTWTDEQGNPVKPPETATVGPSISPTISDLEDAFIAGFDHTNQANPERRARGVEGFFEGAGSATRDLGSVPAAVKPLVGLGPDGGQGVIESWANIPSQVWESGVSLYGDTRDNPGYGLGEITSSLIGGKGTGSVGRATHIVPDAAERLPDPQNGPAPDAPMPDAIAPVAEVVTSSGTKGSWNSSLNNPLPDTQYLVNDRFTYVTDDIGRTIEAETTLDASSVIPSERNTYQQRIAGGQDRLPGDQGGHIFGTQFGGPGEAINITAMRDTLNSAGAREYYQLEAVWRTSIDQGRQVAVNVEMVYEGTSLRPSTYVVRSVIDGVARVDIFDN